MSNNSDNLTLENSNAGSNIIVCGRGKYVDLLPGNITFRTFISEYASQYAEFQKRRTKKSILIRWIASHLKENGMVFVKRTKDGDQELNESEILIKIGHALRDVLKRLRKHLSSISSDASLLSQHNRKEENCDENIPNLNNKVQCQKEGNIEHRQEVVAVKGGPTSNEICYEQYLLTMEDVDDQVHGILGEDIDSWSIHSESEYCDLLKNEEVDNRVFGGIKMGLEMDNLSFNSDQNGPSCLSNETDGGPTQS